MNLRWIRHIVPATTAALIFCGCSSQDFGNYGSSITDIVDSGKPYVEDNHEETARIRMQRLGELLQSWEKRRTEADRDYLVGTDDVLEFGVLSLDTPGEITLLTRAVRHDGMVGLPLIGDMKVAGASPRELEDVIRRAYAGKYIRDPSVTIKVTEYRSAPVVVYGAVSTPGIYYLRHNNSSVLEILGDANGITPAAGDELIIVRNPKPKDGTTSEPSKREAEPKPRKPTVTPIATVSSGTGPLMAESGLAAATLPEQERERDEQGMEPEMIKVNLKDLLVDGDIRMNVTIESGDIITVPPRKARFVYVLGYVQRPGSFELTDSDRMRALQAVAMAGGLSATARAQNSYLISEKGGVRRVVDVDLTKIARGVRPPLYLESGDTLVIGSGMIAKLAEFVRPSLSAGASVSAIP